MHHFPLGVLVSALVSSRVLRCAAACLATVLGGLPTAKAQCTAQWITDPGTFGVNGQVATSALWDPDGSGPLGPRLVLAGSFSAAAYSATQGWTVSTPGVAAYDLANGVWSTIGSLGSVVAIRASSTGGLFAASGTYVYSWDGSSWQPLGSGMNGAVNAITVLNNGDVMAGGAFTIAGGITTNGFARWNGSVWQNPGLGVAAVGHALTTLANGHVIAGGSFTVGGVASEYVARWNGLFWTMLGTSLNGVVNSVTGLPNGDVIAAGDFTTIGVTTVNRVARWNGTAWFPMGTGMDATVHAITTLPNGDVVAGGAFATAGGATTSRIARWSGTTWSGYREGMEATVRSLTVLPGGLLSASGDFVFADRVYSFYVARWDGVHWQTVGTGQPGLSGINAMAFLPNGDLVVGGSFTNGANGINYIARWDGTSWQSLGSGMNGDVNALVVLPNGDLVAGGSFGTAGGTSVSFVARWNGTAWQPMGSGFSSPVNALAMMPNGDVVAGGSFTAPTNYIARWDGSTWQSLGSGMNDVVYTLLLLGNGDLVAGGRFGVAGGIGANYVARWDGAVWQAMGAGTYYYVRSLSTAENGGIIAGQEAYGYVHRWDGTAWQYLGSIGGSISAVASLPNGDILAGTDPYLYRWNAAMGWQVTNGNTYGNFATVLLSGLTDLYAGGSFQGPVHYQTTCPATLTNTGPGCVGGGGLPQTTLSNVPWIGLTTQSRTTNLGASALAFALWGFSNPNVTLASMHPLGGPGCNLYANPDIATLAIPFAGEITTSITIPNSISFAGITLYHQIVQFELDQNFNTIAISSGNGLRLVTGQF